MHLSYLKNKRLANDSQLAKVWISVGNHISAVFNPRLQGSWVLRLHRLLLLLRRIVVFE